MSAEFVHLHLHTEYSLVDSVLRIKKAMPVIAESMAAVALTDQSNLMGDWRERHRRQPAQTGAAGAE